MIGCRFDHSWLVNWVNLISVDRLAKKREIVYNRWQARALFKGGNHNVVNNKLYAMLSLGSMFGTPKSVILPNKMCHECEVFDAVVRRGLCCRGCHLKRNRKINKVK